jgi:hypothetical protein
MPDERLVAAVVDEGWWLNMPQRNTKTVEGITQGVTDIGFSNVDRLCASVDLAQAVPHVDLIDVTFMEPFAMLYLGMFLRYHNSCGREFTVTLPRSTKGWATTSRSRDSGTASTSTPTPFLRSIGPDS